MKCPVCGAADLIRDTRDLSHAYRGKTTTIVDVTVDFCPACNEAILDVANAQRFSQAMIDFNRQVDAQSLSVEPRGTSAPKPRVLRANSDDSHPLPVAEGD